MKRSKEGNFIYVGLIALITLTCGGLSHSQAQGELTATVIGAAGKAAYRRSGSAQRLPVQVNVTKLAAGDIVMTGPSSKVTLRVDGKPGPDTGVHPVQSTIEIGPKAKVVLTKLFADLTSGDEQVQIGVAEGQVISNVRRINPNSERFEVETPTAVAAVRGTRFAADVQWKNRVPQVGFRVERGSISLFNKTGRRLANLNEGDMADIDPSGSSASVGSAGSGTSQSSQGLSGRGGAPKSGKGLLSGNTGESSDTITSREQTDDEGDDIGGRQ